MEGALVQWFSIYYSRDIIQTGTLEKWEENMTEILERQVSATSFEDIKCYLDTWDAAGIVIFNEEFKQVFAVGNEGRVA